MEYKKAGNTMAESIRTYNQIETQYKWDLTHIFPNDAAWEKAYEALDQGAAAFAQRNGRVAEDPKGAIQTMFQLYRLAADVQSYAFLRKETDNGDTTAQELAEKSEALMVRFSTATAFLRPELLEMPEDQLTALMADPEMADYDVYLKELLRAKPHQLSKAEERVLAMGGEIATVAGNVFDMFTAVDMKFPDVTMPDGTKTPLTEGVYSPLIRHRDREVRRQAFHHIMDTYGSFGNTFATIYGGSVKKDQFEARVRNFPSAVEASLFPDEIPLAVYDNLIATVHEYLPVLQEYLALRKQVLGLDELHMYDLYCPMVEGFDMKLPYEEAYQLVLEGLSPMGKEYVDVLKEARDSRWIDVFPAENKSSGAFSMGHLHGLHPYVMLNHNDNLEDTFTIAHEMGHAMHSYYSNQHQPFPKADYSLFVAEVASTCNEAVMMRYLLKKLPEKKAQAYLLNHLLEQFRTTCFRQTMFAEFERISHDMAANGQPLTREALSKAYLELNNTYYGAVCHVDETIANEWMRIPHFYRAFYVFVYATGICAAITLSERILNDGAEGVAAYKRFISAGGSVPPIDALKLAGIDMSSPKPIRRALEVFKETLAQFRTLLTEA